MVIALIESLKCADDSVPILVCPMYIKIGELGRLFID
jgi:hypothetical protein